MDTIRVACGLIYDNGKIFICRRGPDKFLAGYWEFPGGKVEPNESLEGCLARELYEELEMKVEVKKQFKTVFHQYEDFGIELISFICDFISSEYLMSDHDEYEWIDVADLMKKKLAPADIPIAQALLSGVS
jgi:8-oxo-dGTP diphosphatase